LSLRTIHRPQQDSLLIASLLRFICWFLHCSYRPSDSLLSHVLPILPYPALRTNAQAFKASRPRSCATLPSVLLELPKWSWCALLVSRQKIEIWQYTAAAYPPCSIHCQDGRGVSTRQAVGKISQSRKVSITWSCTLKSVVPRLPGLVPTSPLPYDANNMWPQLPNLANNSGPLSQFLRGCLRIALLSRASWPLLPGQGTWLISIINVTLHEPAHGTRISYADAGLASSPLGAMAES
jgi:hypothetical protein